MAHPAFARLDKQYKELRLKLLRGELSLREVKEILRMRATIAIATANADATSFARKFYKGRAGSDTTGIMEDDDE